MVIIWSFERLSKFFVTIRVLGVLQEIKLMANLNLLKDGPIQVSGDFELHDADGNPIDCKDKIALCRCGATGNKPFCDGSHTKTGFTG